MGWFDFLWAQPVNKYFPEYKVSLKNAELGVDPAQYFTKYGSPLPIADVRVCDEFISCYNRALKNPHFVIEHLTTQSRDAQIGDRSRSFFQEDTSIPEKFRARLANYFRCGYDRGHQAPAANCRYSQKAMNESFTLSNVCPQVGEGFNRDYWAHFERFARNLTYKYNSVRIVTGPLYLPKEVGGKQIVSYELAGSNVAVPTHFYKILIGEQKISGDAKGIALAAFVLPNEKISNTVPLTKFEVPLNLLEQASGVEFLPRNEEPVREMCQEVECAIDIKEFINGIPQVRANAASSTK